MTCPQTSTLGVYLLGALEPEERSTFESHLYGCDICRAELVRLAPLPGLLNQISLSDFEESAASPVAVLETTAPPFELPVAATELPDPVVIDQVAEPDTTERPKPYRRFWFAAAAAALVVALVVAGILGYEAMQGQSVPQARTVTWSATNPATGARADVVLTQKSWGTDIRVWMSNTPAGKECKLVILARNGYRDRAGYKEIAGWWQTGHDAHEEIPGATSIDLDMIYQLQFIDDEDTLLVDMHAPQ